MHIKRKMYSERLPVISFELLISPPEHKIHRIKTWSYSSLCLQYLAQGPAQCWHYGTQRIFVELRKEIFDEPSIL